MRSGGEQAGAAGRGGSPGGRPGGRGSGTVTAYAEVRHVNGPSRRGSPGRTALSPAAPRRAPSWPGPSPAPVRAHFPDVDSGVDLVPAPVSGSDPYAVMKRSRNLSIRQTGAL
jgi:hypothetical protein